MADIEVVSDFLTAGYWLVVGGQELRPENGVASWSTAQEALDAVCGLCRGTGDWQEEFIDSAGGVGVRGGVCSVCDGTGMKP